MTTKEMKQWIDNASYEDLLRKWRFAKIGDPFFQGEIGEYYCDIMKRRRAEVNDDEHTMTSKQIGWDDENRKSDL